MRVLTEEKWRKFGSDGILFENLTKDLLELEYPGKTFHLTKHSHDGGKDGVCQIPLLEQTNAEIWMECKYHKNTLPIHEVAMTLVMAMLDNAQQIIFFSYSSVNREFDKYIAYYKERMRIEVNVYDDMALENLILKHWGNKKIQSYFLDINTVTPQFVTSDISVSYDIQNFNKREFYYLNEVVTLQVYITNKNIDKNYTVDICLDMEDMEYFRIVRPSFEKKGGRHKMEILHNTSYCYEIPLQLIRYKEKICTPRISIKYDNRQKLLQGKQIKSRWIAATRLIGQNFYDIKEEALQLLLAHRTLGAIHIYGESGCGKSRLLQEISTFSEYKVFFYNMEKQTVLFKEFIQNLVSFTTGLPLFDASVTVVDDDTVSYDDKRYAAQILYDSRFDFIQQKSKLLSYIAILLSQEKFLIVIDNMQACDMETIDFLDKLIFMSETRENRSFFLLSVNTDQLFMGTPVYNLNEKLKISAAKEPENYLSRYIEGFKYEDAMHFLNECLLWPDKEDLNLKETLDLLIRHCGTQPFFIQNVLLYMVQEGILKRTETTAYYITSIPDFHRAIREIPRDLNALLKKREKLLIEHFRKSGNLEDYYRFIRLISSMQPFPSVLFHALIHESSILTELEDLNLVCRDENNCILFRHQLIGRYFRAAYPIDYMPDELMEETIRAIEARQIKKQYCFFYFLLLYFNGKLNKSVIRETIHEVSKYRMDNSFIELWMKALLEVLPEYPNSFDAKEVAAALFFGCLFIAHQTGLSNSLKYYKKASSYILDNVAYFTGCSIKACNLFREYENSQLNTGLCEGIEAFSKQVEKFLEETEPDTEKLYKRMGEEKIQQCIILNALNQPDAALDAVKEGFEIARRTNDFHLKMKALREQGYVYYYHENAEEFRQNLADSWQSCFKILKEEYLPELKQNKIICDDQPTVAAYLVGLLGDLAAFDYSGADEKATVIKEMLDKTKMPFYEIKLRLALSVYYFIKEQNSCQWRQYYDIQIRLIHQAIDKCVAYFSMRDYPVCFYLLGLVQFYSGERTCGLDNLKKACLLAEKYSFNQQVEKSWSYLFYDIAFYFRSVEQQFPQNCLSEIENGYLADRIKEILSLPNNAYELEIRPVYTALTDKNKQLNIPKV